MLFGRGPGDGDAQGYPGEHMVEVKEEAPMHWTEQLKLGYKAPPRREWPLGDSMADHSDQQGFDKFKE